MHHTSLELPEGKAVTKSESLADIAYVPYMFLYWFLIPDLAHLYKPLLCASKR